MHAAEDVQRYVPSAVWHLRPSWCVRVMLIPMRARSACASHGGWIGSAAGAWRRFSASQIHDFAKRASADFAMSYLNSVTFLVKAWFPQRDVLHGRSAASRGPARRIAPSATGGRSVCCGAAWGD